MACLAGAAGLVLPIMGRAVRAQPIAVCGDGIVEFPETCDDGNLIAGDGCSPICQLEDRPPDCTHATPSVAELWPPNHRLVPVTIDGVTDPDGDPVAVTITAIAQDEPLGESAGHTCPDATGVGTPAASVRAERTGQGDGRVYHVSFSASDGRGGVCVGAVEVCVRHDQRPGGVCGDGGPVVDSTAGGAPPCAASDCDPDECAPAPGDLPGACDGETLPPGVDAHLTRARDLLSRAVQARRARAARRLARRAARHLRAARTGAANAATHHHLSEGCAGALAERLGARAACDACGVPEPGD